MLPQPVDLEIPKPTRDYIVNRIREAWLDSGRDCGHLIEALPTRLVAGKVDQLATDGPFGWILQGRLDEVGSRVALEVVEDSRMSGPSHYTVWDDGSVEELPTPELGYAFPANTSPEEQERIKQESFEHNRRIHKQLEERGFGGG
jgi:hypothetical protein